MKKLMTALVWLAVLTTAITTSSMTSASSNEVGGAVFTFKESWVGTHGVKVLLLDETLAVVGQTISGEHGLYYFSSAPDVWTVVVCDEIDGGRVRGIRSGEGSNLGANIYARHTSSLLCPGIKPYRVYAPIIVR